MDNYILIDGKPVAEPDIIKWAMWRETADTIVKQDRIGGVFVSTVFLGLDHAFGKGPPMLYETMVFGGPHDKYQERYCTRDEALAGHARAVVMVKQP